MKNYSGFLDHLLKSAGATVSGANQTNRGSGIDGAINSDFGRGAVTGGLLGLFLGRNRKLRKLAGYGGLAALGMMVYNTYGDYRRQQAESSAAPAALPPPQTIDRLPPPQAEAHGAAILQAIIAAAKADGHIDTRERELIENECARQGLSSEVQQWLHTELEKPLDPAQIASAASSPELAAEMYLASLLVIDEQSFMEKAYLDELARQLNLPPELQTRLQGQIGLVTG